MERSATIEIQQITSIEILYYIFAALDGKYSNLVRSKCSPCYYLSMDRQSSTTVANKGWWEKMVAEGNGFTLPWLDLDLEEVKKYAEGSLKNVPKPLDQIFPVSVLANLEGKDVLCLAAGGGQQSAIFGILGAHVTVIDIADGQLAGDRKAAQHYTMAMKLKQYRVI